MKKAIASVLAVCITLPIWFFLLYRILESVNASELMWFLYWAYVPVSIVVAMVAHMVKDD